MDTGASNTSSNKFMPHPNPCDNACSTMYYSDGCRLIYVLLIILSIVAIVITLLDIQQIAKHSMLSFMETILNVMTIIDIIWRMYMIGCNNYWRQCINYFELVSLVFCVASIYLSFSIQGLTKLKIEMISDNTIITLRSLAQYFRILIFIRNSKEQAPHSDLHISEIEPVRSSTMEIKEESKITQN